jgi:hypothetical protein
MPNFSNSLKKKNTTGNAPKARGFFGMPNFSNSLKKKNPALPNTTAKKAQNNANVEEATAETAQQKANANAKAVVTAKKPSSWLPSWPSRTKKNKPVSPNTPAIAPPTDTPSNNVEINPFSGKPVRKVNNTNNTRGLRFNNNNNSKNRPSSVTRGNVRRSYRNRITSRNKPISSASNKLIASNTTDRFCRILSSVDSKVIDNLRQGNIKYVERWLKGDKLLRGDDFTYMANKISGMRLSDFQRSVAKCRAKKNTGNNKNKINIVPPLPPSPSNRVNNAFSNIPVAPVVVPPPAPEMAVSPLPPPAPPLTLAEQGPLPEPAPAPPLLPASPSNNTATPLPPAPGLTIQVPANGESQPDYSARARGVLLAASPKHQFTGGKKNRRKSKARKSRSRK